MLMLVVSFTLAFGLPGGAGQAAQRGDPRRWDQAYAEGVNAFNKRDWTTAIASLEAARQKDPDSSRGKRTSDNAIVDYIPDYYLAVAYFNLKRYRESDEAFKRLEQAKLITPGDKDKYVNVQNDAPKAAFEALTTDADLLIIAGRFAEAQAKIAEASRLPRADQSRVKDLMARLTKASAQQSNPPPSAQTAYPTGPPPSSGDERLEQDLIVFFFSGKYEEALHTKASPIRSPRLGEPLTSPVWTPRTKLYVSCSMAALVLMGRADPAELNFARTLYAEALKSYTLDEDLKLISPKILKLLQAK